MTKATKKLYFSIFIRGAVVSIITVPLGVLYVLALTDLDINQTKILLFNIAWLAVLLFTVNYLDIWIMLRPAIRVTDMIAQGIVPSAEERTGAERRLLIFPYLNFILALFWFAAGGTSLAIILNRLGHLSLEDAIYLSAAALTVGAAAGMMCVFYYKKPLQAALKLIVTKEQGGERPPFFVPILVKLAGSITAIIILALTFLALLAYVNSRQLIENDRRGLQQKDLATFRAVLESIGPDMETRSSILQKASSPEKIYCLADQNFVLRDCPVLRVSERALEAVSKAGDGEIVKDANNGWNWAWTASADGSCRIISGWKPQAIYALRAGLINYYLKVALIALASGIVLALFLALDISRPLRQLSRRSREITSGKFDTEIVIGNEDETGILARHFNLMTTAIFSRLEAELNRTRMMLNNIAAAVKALEPLSEQLMAVTEDQVAASQQQSVAAQQVAATSKQIAASSSAMSRKAEEVSEVADQTSASSQKGRAYMGEVITQMKEIKTRVSNVASSIIELGEQSGQIGTVVDIIKEISEQTNLLALNASIEAAGAGEAGKRFTIVAGEVRRLATNTLEATKMIRQRVESIQRLANKVVLLTEEEIKTVDVGAKTINEMGHQFGIIMTMVDGSSRAATEIKSGTLQQSMASDQMASALTEVSQTVAQSEKGVKEIGLAVDELKRVIKELNSLTTSKN